MRKFFPVLSRDKVTYSANLEPSEIQHTSKSQPEIPPNSTNEITKVVDYKLLETDPGISPPISSYHPGIQNKIRKAYLKISRHKPPHNFVYPLVCLR
jgi:hypothetical protein